MLLQQHRGTANVLLAQVRVSYLLDQLYSCCSVQLWEEGFTCCQLPSICCIEMCIGNSRSSPSPSWYRPSASADSGSADSASAGPASADSAGSASTPDPASTAAPASAGSAASTDSASEPELGICSALQHHDDLSARTAKCAADQHVSASKQHTARHRRGDLHTRPTNSVGVRTETRLSQKKSTNIAFIPLLNDCWLVLVLPRFPAGQQLKLVTAPMACGAVVVPTSMFMGQVVTAYNPFGGQQVGTSQTDRKSNSTSCVLQLM